ncbi:MAG TPA: hypothetical protein VHH14_08335 [Solirubrobacterales bacterium]|nr:hypothetical protein [Solirubrobacterales bacterium]
MRLATPLVIVALLVVLAGCGDSSSEETTTAPAVEREEGAKEKVRATWEQSPDCNRPQGASRWGCSVGAYRCQAVVVDRGWSVSCAKPGESIAFRVRPG